MTTPIPLNQPSKQIVVALINRDNNTSFNLSQVDIDNVSAMSAGFARNTSARVFSIPGGGFTPSEVTVYYNRLDLAHQWRNTVAVARTTDPTSTADLLSSLNNLYGLNITLDDVEDMPYLGNPHTVVAKATSLVWRGTVAVTVVPDETPASIPLSVEFSDALSPGFTYDEEENYAFSSATLMYDMLTNITETAHPYNPAHFSLSFVSVIVDGDSTVTLTALPDTGFTGTYVLSYTRMHLSDLIQELTIPVSVFTDGGYSIGSNVPGSFIRNYLNSVHGILLDSAELVVPDVLLEPEAQIFIETTLSNYIAYGSLMLEIVE